MNLSKTDKAVAVLSLLFFIGLVVFGRLYHPIHLEITSEFDRYLERADSLLQGELEMEGFHPLFYSILGAVVGVLVGDTYLGSQLVSEMASVALVVGTYVLGRLVFTPKIGFLAFLSMILNFVLIKKSVQVDADVTFSAFILWGLILAVQLQAKSSYKMVSLLALIASLAYFVRYQGNPLFIASLLSIAILYQHSWQQKLRYGLLFLGLAILFSIPNFLIVNHIFGDPFFNPNWTNLVYKLYAQRDYSKIEAVIEGLRFDGSLSVVMYSPPHMVHLGMRELMAFLQTGLASMIALSILQPIFAGSFIMGVFRNLFQLNRAKLILLFFFLVYSVMVSFTFYPVDRVMLPVFALCFLFIWEFLLKSVLNFSVPWKHYRITGLAVFLIIMGPLQVEALYVALNGYIRLQPLAELEAVRQLETEHGDGITVVGTARYLDRHVSHTYIIRRIDQQEGQSLEAYYQHLNEDLKEVQADFLVVGRATMRMAPRNLLEGSNTPPFLSLVRNSADVAVYRVIHE